MFTSEEDIADLDSVIHKLVDSAEKLTSELRLHETLIRKRTSQIQRLSSSSFKEVLDKFSIVQQNENDAQELYAKLNSIVDLLEKFDSFSRTNETLTEEVLSEYIGYLQGKAPALLIVKPTFTNFLVNGQQLEVSSFLESKNAANFEQIIFVLQASSHYSCILYTKATSSAYHYDLREKKNLEWAERLVFRLREYFQVDQITHFECRLEDVPSSAFLLENLMKIVYRHEKTRIDDDFASQLIKLPPQCDRLVLIVARKYIQIKFSQINDLLR